MAEINDRDLQSVIRELQSIAEELRNVDFDRTRGRSAEADADRLADRLSQMAEQLERAVE